MKRNHGTYVSQTIDTPVMIFDHWELSDAFIALMIVMVFGVIFYAWFLMFGLLVLALGVGPIVKKRNERGIFLHYPYAHWHVSLPGIISPGGQRTYSD